MRVLLRDGVPVATRSGNDPTFLVELDPADRHTASQLLAVDPDWRPAAIASPLG